MILHYLMIKQIHENNGRLLWLSLTHVVILTDQIRQKEHIIYSNILNNIRIGQPTIDDIQMINSRIITSNNYSDEFKNAVYIVARNNLREEINKKKIIDFAITNLKTMYICNSIDTIKKNGSIIPITNILKTYILSLNESKTENLMTQLILVENCQYYLTKNISTVMGLVNGALIELIHIYTKEHVENNKEIITLSSQPYCLIVKLCNYNNKKKFKFPCLDEEMIPIFPEKKVFSISLPGTRIIQRVTRIQYPITPSFAISGYKAQGKTLNKVILDLAQVPNGRLSSAYSYVGLSRVKTIKDILVLRSFNKKILEQI